MVLIRVDTVRFRPTQRDRSTDTLFAFEIRHIPVPWRDKELPCSFVQTDIAQSGTRRSVVYTVEILTTSFALVPCAVQLLLIRIYTVRLNHTRSMY